jgi:hypothetical protein
MSDSENAVEGFYVAYLTGGMGSSFAMFTFKNGIIAGADTGGGKYDGVYEIDESNQKNLCEIEFILPVGAQSITGAAAKAEPLKILVPVVFPIKIKPDEVFRIDTVIGPVNVRLEKIRGF